MTSPHYSDDRVTVYHGECLDVLRTLPDSSVDAVVTDPPAGVSFMGKTWDSDHGGRDQFVAWLGERLTECARVLRPGGYALVWALPRTSHWTGLAVEDSGLIPRDVITHLFGTGFPKSHDVSKAIDKAAGAERERVPLIGGALSSGTANGWNSGESPHSPTAPLAGTRRVDTPATPEAAQWQGWGTALKPASEHWWLAQKPLAEKTYAANVVTHGTGALNIDASRVAASGRPLIELRAEASVGTFGDGLNGSRHAGTTDRGRWPSDVVLSHAATPDGEDLCAEGCVAGCPVAELDAQSGTLKSGLYEPHHARNTPRLGHGGAYGDDLGRQREVPTYGDSGGASRFFPTFRYAAKAPPKERPTYVREGADESKSWGGIRKRCGVCGKQEVNVEGSACACPDPDFAADPSMTGKVAHPTVKSLALMRFLVRLVTPPAGVVLDPFAGSGATVEAALLEGFRCVAIEREAEYLPLIAARINRVTDVPLPFAVEAS